MKLEVSKEPYKTRSGRKVIITEFDESMEYPYKGEIEGTVKKQRWAEDGVFIAFITNNLDIIGLWEEPFTPKRGDEVLVWDEKEKDASPKIFLTEIEGAKYPFVTVFGHDEKKFKNGKKFNIGLWKNMKPHNPATEMTAEVVIKLVKEKLDMDINIKL